MFKRISITLLLFTLTSLSKADVTIYKAPKEIQLSSYFVVRVNGINIDLFKSETRYGNDVSFGYFDFSDSVLIEIETLHPAPHSTSWKILPESHKVNYKNVKNGKISFFLKNPDNLTFVVNGDYRGRTLHLFAGEIEETKPQKDTPGVIYFEPGYHEINPSNNYILNLESNQKVYIAGGAVVKGCIHSTNSENIQIFGRGILMQTPDMGNVHGLDIEACSGVTIEGITLTRNQSEGTGFIYKSFNINIADIKVVSPAIWSTYGLSLSNCTNAKITSSFFRSGNDNIAIKGLGNNRTHSSKTVSPESALPNENITIKNCILWSDNNNAIVLGQETLAEYYNNITIKDCDIIFARDEEPIKAAMAIISLHSTDMRNILFDNIRVGTSGQLITVFNTEDIFNLSGSQSWPGSIHDLTFRNITAFGRGNKKIRIHGFNPEKTTNTVSLETIVINGDTLKNGSYYMDINAYTYAITIDGDTIKKPALVEPVDSIEVVPPVL
jgi:hypothetical protein